MAKFSQRLNLATPRSGLGLNELLGLLETEFSVDCTDN